ncbi:MAG: hypothetical protein AB8H03_26815 [Saprospiraceae bacterium]
MDFIQEIVILLETFQVNKIEIIGNDKNSTTKLNQFFQGIKKGDIGSDEDAIKYLYQKNSNKASYNKLKSRLKEKLINSIFFLDTNHIHYTDIQRAYYYCHKNWAASRILFGRSAKESGVILAEKTFKKSLKFEFTEIIINLSRMLRLHFSTIKGSKRKYNYYNNLINEHLPILHAEIKAEEYYEELLIHFANSKATKPNLAAIAYNYSQNLKSYKGVSSYNFLFFSHTIHVIRYEIINDHINVIKESSNALIKLKKKPFTLRNQLFSFLIRKFSCYLKLGMFDEAKIVSRECQETLVEGTVNWFKFHQFNFCLLTYTKNYHLIHQMITPVTNHPNLKFQSDNVKETWKIIQAYTFFLYQRKKISKIENMEQSKFKLGKYLNELPKFSKDKRGANIHILITQILISLVQKKYDFIIDKTAALSRYSTRYLRKDETYRSNCFIQILMNLQKGNFYKDSFLLYSKKYIKMLNKNPLYSANQSAEFEFIPFEYLLNDVIDLCRV